MIQYYTAIGRYELRTGIPHRPAQPSALSIVRFPEWHHHIQ